MLVPNLKTTINRL